MKNYNQWAHGKTHLVLPPMPDGFMQSSGIYYLTCTLDPAVGEEVILLIYDPTDFIYQLKDVKPFRFFASSLAVNTSFGPVYSFLFWVSQPHDIHKSFTVLDKPVDISRPSLIDPWKRLANQSHVHLLLVGANYQVEGFFEFENTFGFDDAVDTISQLDALRVIDFEKAEQEYFNSYSLEALYDFVKAN
jgi:hypothetical protein